MTVAEVNALLYTPGHSRSQLERAVRIPALSPGWRSSFQALLDRERSGSAVTGNPGLTSAAGPPPAWTGFLTTPHGYAAARNVIGNYVKTVFLSSSAFSTVGRITHRSKSAMSCSWHL
jgi:hypothetical protein